MKTSAIKGEMLDRLSGQSSPRRNLGLAAETCPAKPREPGVAEMMVDLYATHDAPLGHDTLFRWHELLLSFDRRLEAVGSCRGHGDAMQIVSGRAEHRELHRDHRGVAGDHHKGPAGALTRTGERRYARYWLNRVRRLAERRRGPA